MQVGQAGKFGVGRYGAISGRKTPLFDVFRLPDQENFGQGLQADLRQEMPRARHPRILVVLLKRLPHSGACSGIPLLQADLRVSQVRVGRLGFLDLADMCPIRRFKFNRH